MKKICVLPLNAAELLNFEVMIDNGDDIQSNFNGRLFSENLLS